MKTNTVIPSILLSLLLLLTACGGSTEDEPKKASGSKPSTSAEAAAKPEPLLLGTQRYTSPCRLLSSDEVAAIYGATGPYASFSQEVVEQSVPAAEMREIDRTTTGAVDTGCRYSFDNKASTTITVKVDQFSSTRRALQRWKRIKKLGSGIESKQLAGQPGWEWLEQLARENEASSGGVPIRGLDPTVLFVSGRTEFVGVRRNLLITVTRGDYAGQAFMPKQVKGTLEATSKVFGAIYAHADDPELDQAPVPASWGTAEGWPRFLEPCEILDTETAAVATARAETSKVEVDSTPRDPDTRLERNDTPGGKAVSNSCNRMLSLQRSRTKTDYFHADLELVYLAPGDPEGELLESWVVRRSVKEEARDKVGLAQLVEAKVMRATEVQGADQAYVFDYRNGGTRYSYLIARTGPYLFKLDATRSKRRGFGNEPMPEAQVVAASERIIDNITAATKDD